MVTLFSVLLLLSGLTLIVTVLLQDSNDGMAAIGMSEQIWGKGKSNSPQAMLARITTVSAVILMISAIAMAALQ